MSDHPTTSSGLKIRLGTRRSRLAVTQSQWVADLLVQHGHEVELVEVVTEGDVSKAPLATMGGAGVFAAAIRHALTEQRVDLAVHSLKDLPVAPEPGLVVAAVPRRADARDALVARDGLTLGELPPGSVIGTGSPRRAAQLMALGLGLTIKAVRGNVETRLGYVRDGELDGVILARAGLDRLGLTQQITETLEPVQMLPAPGQGALALEVRADDAPIRAAVVALEDADARAAVTAERALLGALGAGCSAPIGALAEVTEDVDGSLEISLRAFAGTVDGSFDLRRSTNGPAKRAAELGADLARILLEDGAGEIIDLPAGQPPDPAPGERPPTGRAEAATRTGSSPTVIRDNSRHVPTSAAEREK
ncbi:hydroxymethylbilane synthase [Leekyejoonella antrihumi]|uniref:Porphobilinogen deaminase n=1 Tax=Leekyejoonella antrihumi TaxID=1660198 RepID=A0A563DWW0_9MICO|nr:hydroxymethylbilane synthase [Leekyejoonella antrihumi]TWP34707.1 hydroxymethylbilane synthase [Leekyejoonella antrihumi]